MASRNKLGILYYGNTSGTPLPSRTPLLAAGAVHCSEADLADLRAAKDALQAAPARAKPAEPVTEMTQ